MYFHASKIPNLTELRPQISNHGKPLVYLSKKRENVLVYLCNAVEKYCKQSGFIHSGPFAKWASYGFNQGILELIEYYPDATIETYGGESGFIYSAAELIGGQNQADIPDAVITGNPVKIDGCEYIKDAYGEMLKAAAEGKMILRKFSENSPNRMKWIEKTIIDDYNDSADAPDYRAFLKAKFHFL